MNNNDLCCICKKELEKDAIPANRKLISKSLTKFMCIDCLADYLGTDSESVKEKIKKFKEEGCVLFL